MIMTSPQRRLFPGLWCPLPLIVLAMIYASGRVYILRTMFSPSESDREEPWPPRALHFLWYSGYISRLKSPTL